MARGFHPSSPPSSPASRPSTCAPMASLPEHGAGALVRARDALHRRVGPAVVRPEYDTLPVAYFEPMARRVFDRRIFAAAGPEKKPAAFPAGR